MFARKTLLCAMTAVLFGAGQATAAGQDHDKHHDKHHDESEAGHSHEMSELHGGRATMTPMHHFEVLFTPDEARVYLYDKSQEPLPASKDVSVSMTLQAKGGETSKLELHRVAPDEEKGRVQGYFAAAHDFGSVKEGSMKALVQVTGLGKKPIEFKSNVVVSEPAVYACPMNDSQPAMDPMKCPKCGMQMVRQHTDDEEAEEGEHSGHDHMDHGGNH